MSDIFGAPEFQHVDCSLDCARSESTLDPSPQLKRLAHHRLGEGDGWLALRSLAHLYRPLHVVLLLLPLYSSHAMARPRKTPSQKEAARIERERSKEERRVLREQLLEQQRISKELERQRRAEAQQREDEERARLAVIAREAAATQRERVATNRRVVAENNRRQRQRETEERRAEALREAEERRARIRLDREREEERRKLYLLCRGTMRTSRDLTCNPR